MKRRCAPFVLIATAALTGAIPALSQPMPSMTAHFIDVGQAHATLLEFSCGAMLIDVGAQDGTHEQALADYLEAFFKRRTDLNRTLDGVLITHNHIDHTRSLRRVVETFTVERYLDNGFTSGSGTGHPNWLKQEVASGNRKIVVREIMDAKSRRRIRRGLRMPTSTRSPALTATPRSLFFKAASAMGIPDGRMASSRIRTITRS